MEKWKNWDSWKYIEAMKIVDLNRRKSLGAVFNDVTTDDLSLFLNIPREEARGFLKSYLYPPFTPESRWNDYGYHELPLNEEYDHQAKKMAQLFAETLNLSEELYTTSLPPFSDKPEFVIGSMWRPLIVEGNRIPWRTQAKLSGIEESFGRVRIKDWNKHPDGFITPEKPYTTWVSMSSKTSADIDSARHNLISNVRGGTILEGIAYWNAYPHIAKGGLFSLPGSQIVQCYREPPDYIVKEWPGEVPGYLYCSEYDRPRLRNYAEKGSICHVFMSTRDIRT